MTKDYFLQNSGVTQVLTEDFSYNTVLETNSGSTRCQTNLKKNTDKRKEKIWSKREKFLMFLRVGVSTNHI